MEDLINAKTFKRLFTETIDTLITVEETVFESGKLTSFEKLQLIEVLEKKQFELYEFLEKSILTLKKETK